MYAHVQKGAGWLIARENVGSPNSRDCLRPPKQAGGDNTPDFRFRPRTRTWVQERGEGRREF